MKLSHYLVPVILLFLVAAGGCSAQNRSSGTQSVRMNAEKEALSSKATLDHIPPAEIAPAATPAESPKETGNVPPKCLTVKRNADLFDNSGKNVGEARAETPVGQTDETVATDGPNKGRVQILFLGDGKIPNGTLWIDPAVLQEASACG